MTAISLSTNKTKRLAKCGWLNACLDTYFAPGQFIFDRSHLVDYKMRADGYYAVMLFQVGEEFHIADVAGTSSADGGFSVCNDGGDMDLATWKTVQVDRYCDGFTTKEDRE